MSIKILIIKPLFRRTIRFATDDIFGQCGRYNFSEDTYTNGFIVYYGPDSPDMDVHFRITRDINDDDGGTTIYMEQNNSTVAEELNEVVGLVKARITKNCSEQQLYNAILDDLFEFVYDSLFGKKDLMKLQRELISTNETLLDRIDRMRN